MLPSKKASKKPAKSATSRAGAKSAKASAKSARSQHEVSRKARTRSAGSGSDDSYLDGIGLPTSGGGSSAPRSATGGASSSGASARPPPSDHTTGPPSSRFSARATATSVGSSAFAPRRADSVFPPIGAGDPFAHPDDEDDSSPDEGMQDPRFMFMTTGGLRNTTKSKDARDTPLSESAIDNIRAALRVCFDYRIRLGGGEFPVEATGGHAAAMDADAFLPNEYEDAATMEAFLKKHPEDYDAWDAKLLQAMAVAFASGREKVWVLGLASQHHVEWGKATRSMVL